MGIDEKNNGGWGWWMRLMDYGALFFLDIRGARWMLSHNFNI